MRPTTLLRQLLKEQEILVVPGAFNALTAKLVYQAGFPVVYATGASIANNMLGLPDVGLVSFGEMRDQVRAMVEAVPVPVIVDADTGYGNALNVIRTVRELEHAGVAAIQLEDQVNPKRCGHFAGKAVVPVEEMFTKIKAAVDTRQDQDLVLIARTDARAVSGLREAIERAQKYAAAGADLTFVEAPRDIAELRQIPPQIAVPQVANMVEGGLTPLLSAGELAALGFKVVLHANCVSRAGILAMQGILDELYRKGTTREALDKLLTMQERNRVTDMASIKEMENKYLHLP